MRSTIIASLVGVCLIAVPAAHAQFSAVNDFSTANNPNGVWRYGQTATLGGTFTIFTNKTSSGTTFAGWTGTVGGFPIIQKNLTGSTQTTGTVTYPSDALQMHPASDGTFSVVRFIAPTAGSYQIAGRFQALDSTTTDVHVLLNNTSLFDSTITNGSTNPDPATAPRSPFSLLQTLAAGDTVDFAVGYGSNRTYFNDSTGLAVTISATSAAPEASPFALLILGGMVGGIAVVRRRNAVR